MELKWAVIDGLHRIKRFQRSAYYSRGFSFVKIKIESKEKRKERLEVYTELIAVLVGGILSIVTTWYFNKNQEEKIIRHNAAMLYYDLLSILKYFNTEYDGNEMYPEIRYNTEWQNTLNNLYGIKNDQILTVYNIYDTIFDYNAILGQEKNKQDYRRKIENQLKDKNFLDLLQFLKKQAKIN